MAKQDLLDEAAALGIEGLDDSFTNKKIQEAIDAARADDSPEPSESDEVAVSGDLAPEVEEVAEEEVQEAPVASEPVYDLDQLKPYAHALFGVGPHVLVGASSAGFIPSGKVTREQVRHGIDQYLNMPVERKEG